MKEIFLEYWPAVVSALASLVVSFCGFLIWLMKYRQKVKENKILKENLEKARLRSTYFYCPECGCKVKLSDVVFRLPGDLPDQDLDGCPDE